MQEQRAFDTAKLVRYMISIFTIQEAAMPRQPNNTISGGPFKEPTITLVWNKATVVPGYDAARYRKDRCGAWIARSSYGTMGDHGWEIDHLKPVAKGGIDDLG